METRAGESIPLVELELSIPVPEDGWSVELGRRGVQVVRDDIGRPSIPRAVARNLLAEYEEREARKAAKRAQIESGLIEADKRFRAGLPTGIPAAAIPEGMTGGLLMMAADPMRGSRRQTVLEHSLENPAGAIVYTPIGEDAP